MLSFRNLDIEINILKPYMNKNLVCASKSTLYLPMTKSILYKNVYTSHFSIDMVTKACPKQHN